MRKLLTSAALLLVFCAMGQQRIIFGHIREASSGLPIETGVLIAVKDSINRERLFEKKSNPHNGYFELIIDASVDTLIIREPGYETRSINIKEISGKIPSDQLKLRRTLNLDLTLTPPEAIDDVMILGFQAKKNNETLLDTLIGSDQKLQDILLTQDYDSIGVIQEGYDPHYENISDRFHQDVRQRLRDTLTITLNAQEKLFSDRGISTAGKRNQRIAEIPASVVIIGKEEISSQGYQSVAEILENVTGLYLFKDYSWSGGDPIVGMRGFFSQGFNNDMIILVNGINQYQDYWGFYPFASFPIPVEAIDRIEIVRGPMSVLYGSGAFFGAINIITNDNANLRKNKSTEQFASLSYGSLDSRRVSGGIKYNQDRIKFAFNAQLFDTDGLNQPFSRFLNDSVLTSETTQDKLAYDQRYLNLSVNLQDKSGRVQTNLDVVSSSENRGIFESTVSSSNDFCRCPLPQANPNAEGSVNRTTSTYGALQVNWQPQKQKTTYNASINFFNFRTGIDYNAGGNRFGLSSFSSKAFEMEVSAAREWKFQNDIGISGIMGVNIRRANDLLTTFDIPSSSFTDGNNYIALADDSEFTLLSAFAEVALDLSKQVSITGGFRIEDLRDFDYIRNPDQDTLNNLAIPPDLASLDNQSPVLIPRAALVYAIDRFNHLKLLYGVARKRPSFGNFTDNASLQFPSIQTLEINFIRESKKAKGEAINIRLNASLYYNQIKDLISRISTVDNQGNSIFQSSNARKVNTLGGEVGLFIRYANNWNMEVSTSLNSSQEEQTLRDGIVVTEEAPSYSPSLLGYFKTSYIHRLQPFEVTTGINMRYISQVSTEFELNDQNTPERIGNEVPGYMITNFNLRLNNFQMQKSSGLFKDLFISVNISNLTDTKIQYPATGNNAAWAEQGAAGFGRRYQLTIGLDM
ncbi:MAG: TonB-dependent receptor plug domain-containing protein [Cyclobacteriaceae bacterium]|nr:TonB-dependent receptor plug domain-containing protein [Cyclobacteriaceae bacterium HetDA_MAG_MS6]